MHKTTKTNDAQQNKGYELPFMLSQWFSIQKICRLAEESSFLRAERESCILIFLFRQNVDFPCRGLSNIIHLHYVGFRHQANGSLHFSYPPAISIVFLAKNVNHITTFKWQFIRKSSCAVPQTLVKISIIGAFISWEEERENKS